MSVIFATAMVVNLRFLIFAAAVGPHFSSLSWYKRIWYGYFNVDIVMAFFPRRFPQPDLQDASGRVGFFSGIVYPNWWAWQCGTIVGALLAGQIMQSWGIGFAGTLALLTVTMPLIINSSALIGVVVSAAVAVAGVHWPYRLGLLSAILAGMTAAMIADSVINRDREAA
jgi:predicted branched-subunit amino acid permease